MLTQKFNSVRPLFIIGTQIRKLIYFWWNPRAFWPCIDINTTDTFKAQKGSKDIIKIVHVTSVVQPLFYKATRILFVGEENKNNNFIQQFLLFFLDAL